MNRDNIRKWVDALRSGDYGQGRHALASGGRYCCLGVACDLAVKDGLPIDVTERMGSDTLTQRIWFDDADAILPPSVRQWLGIDECDPKGIYNGEQHKLSMLNDDGGFNFDDIADIIERTYLADDDETRANNFVSRVRATQEAINAGGEQ